MKAATQEEKQRNIEQGLAKAREAVQLDTSDGLSWCVLGNAYLSHFFSVSQNPRTLKQAMSAYRQAEKDAIARSSSDLFFNKGVVSDKNGVGKRLEMREGYRSERTRNETFCASFEWPDIGFD